MSVVHIYVEGDGDVKFISDYINHIKPDAIKEIHSMGGWTSIKNAKPEIERYKDAGNIVLVIFDADFEIDVENNGGYVARKKEIGSYGLPLDDIFLFPDNQSDGALEDLLEEVVNPQNKPIFDCWEKYEDCLRNNASAKTGRKLIIPAKKAKIYSYLGALLGEVEEVREPYRNYKETCHWDLDSNALIPLKTFLEKYL